MTRTKSIIFNVSLKHIGGTIFRKGKVLSERENKKLENLRSTRHESLSLGPPFVKITNEFHDVLRYTYIVYIYL